MPATLSYPGVYIEEIPSGVRTIVGVPTSVTAFIGRTKQGPLGEAVDITSWQDFERVFGGLWESSKLPFAVRDFYLNGGTRAVIVRLFRSSHDTDGERVAVAGAIADLKAAMEAVDASDDEAGKKVKAASESELGKEDGTPAGSIRGKAKKASDDAIAAKQAADQDRGNAALQAAAAAARAKADEAAAAVEAAEVANSIIGSLDDAAKDENEKTPVSDAIAVASATGDPKDQRELSVGEKLNFKAISPGKWGGNLRLAATPRGTTAFDLEIVDTAGGPSETFLNLTAAEGPRRVDRVLANESKLLRWNDESGAPTTLPDFSNGIETDTSKAKGVKRLGDEIGTAWLQLLKARNENPSPLDPKVKAAKERYNKAVDLALASVGDGRELTSASFLPTGDAPGIETLEELYKRDGLFNLLCIPPYKSDGNEDVDVQVIAAAAEYCERRRAMLIVDPPKAWDKIDRAVEEFSSPEEKIGTRSKNAALFFPRLKQPNPFRNGQVEEFAPCGVVAGIFARTDAERGVWKAPAGIDAALRGVRSLKVPMTDLENGLLNPLGVNCLRHFPIYGQVVWGARTLEGADARASEWKYTPVRRTALFIEESLFRGTKWVVFQPNDEPLWAQIRLAVGSFMHNLFRQRAFQGRSPDEAYFVKCDDETTTQSDINLGIVNIHVGFAPLKPCEFVVIKLQQMAGQIEV